MKKDKEINISICLDGKEIADKLVTLFVKGKRGSVTGKAEKSNPPQFQCLI